MRTLHSSCSFLGAATGGVGGGVDQSSQFVVCGAGAGGLAVAARLCRKFGEGRVTIVDPAQVGAGCRRADIDMFCIGTLLSADVDSGWSWGQDTG